jgi:hypothetical protein
MCLHKPKRFKTTGIGYKVMRSYSGRIVTPHKWKELPTLQLLAVASAFYVGERAKNEALRFLRGGEW